MSNTHMRVRSDVYACRGDHRLYRSPLRPLNPDYVRQLCGVSLDLDHTEIGEWHPAKIYAFNGVLPGDIVFQQELEEVAG